MRTKLRSKFALLFMTIAVVLAVPAIAFAQDVTGSTSPAPTIQSDKDDYAPGELVTLTGGNWQPGESVNIKVNDTYGASWSRNVDVTADSNGNITDSFNLPDAFVSDYDVTATGSQSGTATTTFTDNKPNSVAVTPASRTVAQGTNTTTYTVVVGLNGNNTDACTVTLNAQGLPPNTTHSFSGNPRTVSATTSSFTSTLTVNVTNLTAVNTYPFTVHATSQAASCQNAQDITSNSVNLVVTPAPNSAPTVSNAAADASGSEGSTLTTNGAFSDADGNGTLTITKQSGAGTVTDNGDGTWSWSHTPNDNGNATVVVQASDGIAPAVTDSFDWSASNVAPTATKAFDTSVDEGSSFNLALNSPSDPSSADTTAGFEYRFDCGSGFGAWGAASSTSCSTNDNGPRNVNAEIRDKDLTPVSTYTGSVTVNNVAPTATFEYPSGTVNEGSSFTLKLTNPSDPSSADTTAGFTYAFDCGDGSGFVADPNNDGEFSCSTNDNGSRTVRGKVIDKDDGSTTYPTSGTVQVSVVNVDPTGALGNNGPKNEGSAVTVSFSNPSDASSVDAASLHYAFDCQGGSLSSVTYATASTTNSKSCTFNDNGSYNVTGVIIDKDGGRHSASTTVTVTNADPVVSGLSVTSSTNGVACLSGNTVKFGFSFTDAGSADTHGYSISWGDNSADTVVNNSATVTSPVTNVEHTYNGLGPYTITVTVTDDDSGSDTETKTQSFHYNIGTTLLSPVNADSSSIFKVGSTIPLKVNITDCSGAGVTGLSPDIRMIKTSSSAPLTGVDEGISTQPNDANWVMRDAGNGQYIYNLASKSLPDSTATYKAVITHNGYSVTSTNYFGLKTK